MKALRYTKRLVTFDSTSHKSNRLVSKYLEMKLTKHGFVVEKVKYKDSAGVSKVNIIAKKGGGHGGLGYFSHSDVVPVKSWFTDKFGPFEPTIGKERLYGRGSCDMKGSIACMLAAAQQFSVDDLKQPLYFVCTADEEVGFHGARAVVEDSRTYREMVTHGTRAIIGEPTSLEVVHAHKGSYEIVAESKGVAAHSSTREGVNANLAMIPFLAEMKAIHDESESAPQYKNSMFQPSTVSWNIGIKDDAQALNITAASSRCTVYLRPMPEVDLAPLLERVVQCGVEHGLQVQINRWGEPFYTDPDHEFIRESVKLANRPKPRTVSYGTDGGVFSELADKIVFGPGSIEQAHTDNEWIALEQLKLGTEMYAKMIRHWCCQ
ncbi:MAG: M20/M25/M40 family metallo-hydrolase [Planctomycetota bacterium]|nr:M20/M25/M40 family metallo-hydrolase [Planctomycetota bacterium]